MLGTCVTRGGKRGGAGEQRIRSSVDGWGGRLLALLGGCMPFLRTGVSRALRGAISALLDSRMSVGVGCRRADTLGSGASEWTRELICEWMG